MSKRAPYELMVEDVRLQTPHLRRIVLSGDALANFPDGFVGGYVKLLFDQAAPHAPLRSIPAGGKPDFASLLKRSYTVAAFDRAAKTLTLDFVCMAGKGPATEWANHAQVGESLVVAGPGPVKMLDASSDWVLLCGDMTALPAIAANFQAMPEHMRGYAIIHVLSEADKVELSAPEGIEVQWIVNAASCATELVDAVRSKAWLPGRPGVWSASEFSIMRALRGYFRDEKQVPSSDLYISSYWKHGATDEEHKSARQSDSAAS